MEERIRKSVTMRPEGWDKANQIAKHENRNRSNLIEVAVNNYYEKIKNELYK